MKSYVRSTFFHYPVWPIEQLNGSYCEHLYAYLLSTQTMLMFLHNVDIHFLRSLFPWCHRYVFEGGVFLKTGCLFVSLVISCHSSTSQCLSSQNIKNLARYLSDNKDIRMSDEARVPYTKCLRNSISILRNIPCHLLMLHQREVFGQYSPHRLPAFLGPGDIVTGIFLKWVSETYFQFHWNTLLVQLNLAEVTVCNKLWNG